MKTHYDVLGVPPNAEPETVKAAYRKIVKVFHPDLHDGDDTAELRSKQIITAYDVLKDPERRARYDEQLRNRRSRLRMFVITVLMSAGLVSGSTLFLLQFLLKPETGAPVARIATAVTEKVASWQDVVPEMAATATPRSRETGEAVPDVSAAPSPVPAAAEPSLPEPAAPPPQQIASLPAPAEPPATQETAWQQIEKSGGVENIWAFIQERAGTPDAALAQTRLKTLIDAAEHIASLRTLAAKATGAVAERALGRIAQLPSAKDIITAAIPEQTANAPPAEAAPVAPPLAAAPPEPQPVEAAREDGGAKLASSDPEAAVPHALSLMTTPVSRDSAPIAPGNANYYVHRAAAWVARGDLGRALTDYDAAILLDDANIAAFHGRGLVRRQRGEVELALADFDQAIRLSFSDPKIYLDRGMIWYERGRYDRAIADFNQAIKLSPGLASAYSYRGTALRRKREFKNAIADLDQAIRLNPAIVDAYRNRDLARTEKDDPVEAAASEETR